MPVIVQLPSAAFDAFSRQRVSSPDTVFDASFQYDLQPFVFETAVTGTGAVTHAPAYSSAQLAIGAGAGTAAVQSRAYHRYIPGKSQLVLMTAVMGAHVVGSVARMGYYDADNGIFLERDGTGHVHVVRRSNTTGVVVEERVEQNRWNLTDLRGSKGADEPTLDLTKSVILVIDLQWLGMGRVRIGFDIGGEIWYVHEFRHANVLAVPYIRTANLPVRWSVTGTAATTMLATCCAVISEGGADRYLAYQFAYNRAVITANNGTATYAFSIRPKATFNALVNRSLIRPAAFDCMVTGNYPVLVEVYHGTAIGGAPSWTNMNASSGLQVDLGGTPSGGTKVLSFWAASTTSGSVSRAAVEKLYTARYPLTLDIAGTGYTNLTVYVTAIGGTSTCYPGLAWEEVR